MCSRCIKSSPFDEVAAIDQIAAAGRLCGLQRYSLQLEHQKIVPRLPQGSARIRQVWAC
jgi:hypothetical protein